MASISIPILDEMVDEVRYEMILLWTAIFNTMITGKKKKKGGIIKVNLIRILIFIAKPTLPS